MKRDPLIVITGGAGFIGSNMVRFLNEKGITKIVIVDDFTDGHKFKNLQGCQFSSYIDKDEFLDWFRNEGIFYEDPLEDLDEIAREIYLDDDDEEEFQSNVACVIHFGACSNTAEWDGKKMMAENYEYTTQLLSICQFANIPFIYASSASVYGNTRGEGIEPLNMYAFSKWCIDQYATKFAINASKLKKEISPIIGLRLFNVYGPNEDHKERVGQAAMGAPWPRAWEGARCGQSSPIHKWYNELKAGKEINVFQEEAKRDFVHVDDVCAVTYWFMNSHCSGIFDVGTGYARSFSEVANTLSAEVFPCLTIDVINSVPMPEHLKGHYQYFTQANLEHLIKANCSHKFMTLEKGIKKFVQSKEGIL